MEKVNPEEVQIEAGWKSALAQEFAKPYFSEIKTFLRTELTQGTVIFPPPSLIFNAFNQTPFSETKVVILGQDPYHQPGQAMGLSFSVPRQVTVPRSLQNIYRELERDCGIVPARHGDLTHWAHQGVLLLNAMLSVERGKAGSHRHIGWQTFTDAVISTISARKEGVIFLLWGNFAKSKRKLIDQKKHHVLEAVHPSPLAGNGFMGSQHFSKTNALLESQGMSPINWSLPE